MFCELLLCSQVIFKSMKVADVRFWWRSECEWVKYQNEKDLYCMFIDCMLSDKEACSIHNFMINNKENQRCNKKTYARITVPCFILGDFPVVLLNSL